MIRVVLDTDIVVAALRSPRGGSAEVLRWWPVWRSCSNTSPWQRALNSCAIGASRRQVLSALDDIAALADEAQRHFRWRPQLRDAADEMVLEAAINGRARFLMTFNRRDFGAAPARFGVLLCTPAVFLRSLQA